jgi:hypothetical protein
MREWGDVPPHWMSYVTVADCDAAARKAEATGATLLVPPKNIEGVGRFAVVTDPQGAAFSILKLV